MKTPPFSFVLRPRGKFRPSLFHSLTCAALAASLWANSAHATAYYWDTNGVAAGAGQTPTGTWDGTNAFFNTDSTGGNGTTSGTFVSTLASTDTVQFVAGPTLTAAGDTVVSGGNAYTVTVSGTETAGGLTFDSSGALTLGATVGGGTIALGSTGITGIRYTTGTTVVSNVIINSNLQLTADQSWVTSQVSATTSPAITITGAITGTSNVTIADTTSRTFSITGAMSQTGNLIFSGGNTVASLGGNVGMTGNLNIGFSAVGANVTLSRAAGNSYTGTTAVTGGTLALSNTSGSATSTGNVTLSSGAAVGIITGTGISTGLLTVTSNGQITPGTATAAGTLTLGSTGGMTLTSAVLNLNLSASATAGNDLLKTSTLTLGNTLTVNLAQIGTTANALSTTGTYTLISDSGGTALNLASTTITTNFSGFTGSYTPTYSTDATGDLLVSFAAVPEPSTVAALVLFAAVIGWTQRRRLSGTRASMGC